MTGRWRVYAVCEDRLQERFLGRLLIREQIVNMEFAPAGRGSAVAWVLKRLPVLVREVVRARQRQRVALLAMLDGDSVGPAVRTGEVRTHLLNAGEEPLRAAEAVALLVPTWSIETWIRVAIGECAPREDVSQKEANRTYSKEDLAAAVAFVWGRNPGQLESLQLARAELVRVFALKKGQS